MASGSGTYYYGHNPLGSVTDLTDGGGAAQWNYSYDPYGAPLTTTNVSGSAPENRLRFDGQYLDTQVSTYNLRARQYDPVTGRFAALDPATAPLTAPSTGSFVYANAQPSVLVDPLGLCPFACLGSVAAVVHGIADTALSIDKTFMSMQYNPAGFGRQMIDAVRAGYESDGLLGGFNADNPAYALLISGDACNHATTARGAGAACSQATIDTASLATVCAVPEGALDGLGARLADETGSLHFSNAAETGTDLAEYDPELASRQLLNQPLAEGYARTPAGRTVSAHAADRIVNGGPGRPPTTLEHVDRLLDTGTEVRYNPLRDTIRVRASTLPGRPYVVVSASDPNHIVTVMVPK